MTQPLRKIADCPGSCVAPDATVQDAVKKMIADRVGAVAVVEDGRVRGIFTERDLMTKVVGEGLDASRTPVTEAMAVDPVTASLDMRRGEAVDLMLENHFRHIPVVDDEGSFVGMVSIRQLLRHQMGRLQENVQALEHYLGADGPGG